MRVRRGTGTKLRGLAVAAAAVGVLAGCSDSGTEPGPGEAVVWRDLGVLPGVTRVSAIAVLDGRVYVGTGTGVLSRALEGEEEWRPAGLEGLDVQTLVVWPHPVPTLWAGGYPTREGVRPVYRTTGDGRWTAGGDGLRSTVSGDWLGVAHIVAQPGAAPDRMPVLYAVASGTNVARSRDGGATWSFVVGQPEEMATYDCLLHVHGEGLYQGCEAPLDHAWVRRYDVADRARPELGEGEVVIDGIENRRINSFATFPHIAALAQTLFVGLEGAVVALEPAGGWRWIHRVGDATGEPYTYVRSVWIDPADPQHILFGGGESEYAEDRSGLRESFDGGKTAEFVKGPAGIDFRKTGVPASLTLGDDGRALLLVTDDGRVRRVLLREEP